MSKEPKFIVDLVALLDYVLHLNPLISMVVLLITGALRFIVPDSKFPEITPYKGLLFWVFIISLIIFSCNNIIWIGNSKSRKKEEQVQKAKDDEQKRIEQERRKEQERIQKAYQEQQELQEQWSNLYVESKGILRDFIEAHNQPRQLWVDDEGVGQLELKKIIEQVSEPTHEKEVRGARIGMRMCFYKVTQTSWEYLLKNQRLVY